MPNGNEARTMCVRFGCQANRRAPGSGSGGGVRRRHGAGSGGGQAGRCGGAGPGRGRIRARVGAVGFAAVGARRLMGCLCARTDIAWQALCEARPARDVIAE